MVLLNRSQVESAVLAGEFKVLAWSGVVALALLHLDRLKNRSDEATV